MKFLYNKEVSARWREVAEPLKKERRMKTCKDCFHRKACKAMLEALYGYILPDDFKENAERCPDFIRADCVIVLPCKAGDTVYSIDPFFDRISIEMVLECTVYDDCIVFRSVREGVYTHVFAANDVGTTVFRTREEAEKALAERMAADER